MGWGVYIFVSLPLRLLLRLAWIVCEQLGQRPSDSGNHQDNECYMLYWHYECGRVCGM
jgi:hypothetical protein